jgi:hypothetical protein
MIQVRQDRVDQCIDTRGMSCALPLGEIGEDAFHHVQLRRGVRDEVLEHALLPTCAQHFAPPKRFLAIYETFR